MTAQEYYDTTDLALLRSIRASLDLMNVLSINTRKKEEVKLFRDLASAASKLHAKMQIRIEDDLFFGPQK